MLRTYIFLGVERFKRNNLGNNAGKTIGDD